jgi:competence protein ComEC
MLERFDAMHVPVEITSKGRRIPLGNDATIDVLWPPPNRSFTTTNNAGLVLRLTYSGRSVLLPADIQVSTERELLTAPTALSSDVLVAPHHGSAEETTAAFLIAAHPMDVISSNGQRLSKKQKEFDALAKNYPLYRTSRYGAVTIRISKDGTLRVETFLHPTK